MENSANKFMVDLLKKAQEEQVKVALLNNGYSMHIDMSSHQSYLDGSFLIGFDVTLFDDTDIVNAWYFSARDEREESEHIMEDLKFRVERL